ncbi:hypothetical protein EX30DRAFT_397855 [Ascodesmis nigricans]|uniref:MFS general substrate transporter n=1 Tax=Ascodesmis nigricans TaxID=341454 RepID=A0A4S2MS62_9PEZI|nr:hypothetical protein EX30DRAFT_397855 [Ascodesmis nigricans]
MRIPNRRLTHKYFWLTKPAKCGKQGIRLGGRVVLMCIIIFAPIVGIGASSSAFALLLYDHFVNSESRALKESSSRLPLAFLGDPISLLPLIPMSSGLFFSLGMELTYISLLNYDTDSYLTYAASAMAATNILNRVLGAVMPLMARPLYMTVGVKWGTSVLGFLCVALAVMALCSTGMARG